MKVRYNIMNVADCTSDPHYVAYSEEAQKERIIAMMDDIIKVCENDMVQNIRCVQGAIDSTHYESDGYANGDWRKTGKPAMKGQDAKRAKIDGLFFSNEPSHDHDEYKLSKDLPSGMLGVKRFVEEVKKNPMAFKGLQIGVIWKFAGDHSCSDYIEVGSWLDCSTSELDTVNYGSQDWWIDEENYIPWCDEMEALLDKSFPRARDK